MRIPVILGTGRVGRQSEKMANFVLEQVEASGIETELLDVKDHASRVGKLIDSIRQLLS